MGHGREQVKKLLEKAIREGLFPGVSLLIIRSGGPVFEICAGRQTYVPWSHEITPRTWFDLASLTKPLVTTLCCMVLAEKGVLSLDQSLTQFFPHVSEDKARITIRHLLNHASGFPAYVPYYLDILKLPGPERKEALISLILDTDLVARPGQRVIYSDLGFILLGKVVELVSKRPLDQAWDELIARPLAVSELLFRPLDREHEGDSSSLAPTGFCEVRERIVWGEVHDLNAYSAGGVCGHAGLFGTARGIGNLLIMLVDIYHSRHRQDPVSAPVLKYFWTQRPFDASSSWVLGFDTPSPKDSSAGRRFSAASVGHLGFTGTSFWIDLEQDLMVILLSNRTFPMVEEGDKKRMKRFRQECHDLIWEIL